jgi:hypothetical protein
MIIAGRDPTNSTDSQYASGYLWLSDLAQGGTGTLFYQGGNSAGLPSWTASDGLPATTSLFGVVKLATLAQLEAGSAPAGAVTAKANDIFTFVNSVAVMGGTAATTAVMGLTYLADATAVVSPYAPLHGVNTVVPVGQITTIFASPPAIGSLAQSAGTFTTLGFTTMTGTAGGTLASGGTTIGIGADNSADAINIGTQAARTIIIGSTSATNSELIGGTTVTVNGTTGTNINIGAGVTTGTIRIGGSAQAAGHIIVGSSTATNTLDLGIGNGVNTTNISTGSGTANNVNLATGNGGNTVTILGGTSANTLQLSNGVGGDTINMASGANTSLQTVNIANGTGTGGSTVNILSGVESSGTSTLLLADSPRVTQIDMGNVAPSATRNIYIGACQSNAPAHTDNVHILDGVPSTATNTLSIINGITSGGTQTISIMSTTAASTAQNFNLFNGANTTTTNTVNIAGSGATGSVVGINIGTGAAAHVLSLGSTSAGNMSLKVATGSTLTIDGGIATTYNLFASTTIGTITIGGTAQTGATLIIGASSATNTVALSGGSGANTLNLADRASISNANVVNILNGATPAASQTLAVMAGVASAGTQSAQFLGGANTTGSQNFQVFNGAIAGATDSISLFSGTIASGTCTFNLFNGNASGGTLVANIFGSVAATTIGTVNINTGPVAHVLNIGSASAGNTTITQAAGSTFAIVGTGGTINIGIDAANTIQIGNGAFATTTRIGSVNTTSTTTINGGSGGVNVTGANLQVATAGKMLQIKGASFAATNFIGVATLSSGTVTVNNTNIAAGDVILITRTSINGSTALGELITSIIASTSFTITSVIVATPGSTQTNDVSIVAYMIVRPS